MIPVLWIRVPGQPVSDNAIRDRRRAGATGGAAFAKSSAARDWQDAVAWHSRVTAGAGAVAQWPRPLLVLARHYVGGNADVANYLKLSLDGLKAGIDVDDYWYSTVCCTIERRVVPLQRGALLCVAPDIAALSGGLELLLSLMLAEASLPADARMRQLPTSLDASVWACH